MGNWINKPPLGSQIDYSNPLSQSLVGAWIMNEGGGVTVKDLAKKNNGILSSTLTRKNNGILFNSQAQNILLANNNFDLGDNLTISIVCNFSGSRTRHNILFAKRDSWASNDMRWQFARNNDTDTLMWQRPSFSADFSGYSLLTGLHSYTLTAISAISNKLYIDGVFKSSGSQNISFDTDVFAKVYIGNEPSLSSGFDGIIYCVFAYNRVLSPSEIMSLYVAPYQMIYKPSNRFYFTPAAGGGNYKMKSMTIIES